MENFNIAEEALETSLNSAGSAMKEHEKWQQSLEAQILSLKAAWQGLSQAFLSSDFLKGALDAIIGLVEGITKLIDTIGVVPTLLGGFGLFKLGQKGLGSLFGFKKSDSDLISSIAQAMGVLGDNAGKSSGLLGKLGNALKGVTGGATSAGGAIKGIASSLGGLIMQHPYITAAVVAVTALTAAFMYQQKQAEDLAKEVDSLVSTYKEQHSELTKLENDYDTSNESSMISKYERLSKGVDGLGRNVSLTTEEYSEYQSIVNSIAEQIPSLVSGYDEQGNALLTCKGNVEELTKAYEKLIHAQNQDILTNTGKLEKDFANTLEQAEKGKWYKALGGIGGGTTTSSMELLQKILDGDYSAKEIGNLLKDAGSATTDGIYESLKDAGIGDLGSFWSEGEIANTLEGALKKDSGKIKNIIENYYGTFEEAIDQQKTIAQAKLSEAFDVSSAISGLNYGNIGEDLQAIAYQTVNSLDFDFFSKLSESGKSVEQWTTEMLNQLNAISKADNAKIEAGFELQTQFNGGDISYGEYVKNLQDIESVIDGLNLKGEAKEQLKISLGLDDEGVIDQYNALVKRLTDSRNYDFSISENEAKKLLDGLSSEELAIAVDVITDMSNNNYSETAEEIKTAIERELSKRGLSLDLDIEVEKTKLEAVATAISESFSGSGLSEESISAVEGMFSSLSSYDSSKLFERTANGIRLNSEEYRKLNSEYKKTNVANINKEMDSLGDIYNQTREELYRLTYGTDEYNAKASELSGIEQQIKDLEKLAAGYEGVASAFQEWQMMESAGSQRDMYESIIEGFENIDDEIKRGWYDDGTIEFLELLSGKDLSTAGIEEVKKAYSGLKKEIKNTGYTVRDFFTTDEDGNSTNTGVYNFLKAIDKLEKSEFGGKDVVKRDGKTNKVIGFDFQVVGGDEVIAETLGISEELVQIMVRAADDAGFVVSMDGTYQQLDVLKEKAQEAAESLNRTLEKSGKKGFDFNFNSSNVDDIKKQLTEAQKILDTFRNTDGTINTKLEGADEALTVASTLQSMLDKLTRPAYMDIEVSQVEDELQEPLRNLQELRRLLETEHQLKLTGADTSELEKSKQEVYEYFEGLDSDVKVKLGLVDEKGNPLTGQSLKDKLNSGDIAIEATVDIQMKMDDKLGILVDKALLDAGIIDGKEFEKRVDIYLNADVDNEEAKNKTEQAVKEVTDGKGEKSSSKSDKSSGNKVEKKVDVDVKADEVDTSDVKNKTKETVEKESEEKLAVETTVELETTIDEALDLIDKFEDKDITIDVKVKGLNDVKELNQNIDLATEISGSVDKLSEYVEGAKALSELDDNITSYVTANIEGNVTDLFTTEGKLDNLKVFAEGAKELKGVGSFTSKVVADVEGNVINTPEGFINNLKVFSDSAKDVESIGENVKAKVTAEIDGNVTGLFEEQIDNLKVYSDNAKKVGDIGEVTSSVSADVNGNITGLFEEQIDNLKTYSDNAKEVESIGEVTSSVTADVKGNITGLFEEQIDNLKVYSDSAKKVEDIGSVESSVAADINGNVKTLLESQIDNLKVYSDSAKEVEKIGDVESKVAVDVKGNITNLFDGQIDNLKVYSDSAKEVESIGDVSSSVEVDVGGNITGLLEEQIDNLKVYSDNAKEVDSIGDISSSVKVDVNGNVTGLFEEQIDNLKVYSDNAKEVKSIGEVSSKVTADIGGNVKTLFEEQIDNLEVYADSAKEVKDVGDVSSKVTADVDGNVIWTPEGMLNNLKTYTKSAKDLDGLGNVSSEVTADINGNVKNTSEESIDNLKVYAAGAKALKGVGSFTSEVNANIGGNVKNTPESSIDNLGVFADNANKLKNTGNFTSSVAANVSGNVVTDDSVVTDLEHFASVVSGLPNQTVTVSVTANIDSTNINSAIDLLTKAANSGVFKDYKATVQVGAKISTIDAAALINYKPPKKEGTVNYKVDSSKVDSWKAPTKSGTVNYSASVEALTDAQKHKTGTITYKAKIEGGSPAAGTASPKGSSFSNGSSGRAFARGDWGIKGNGVALGGEMGTEIVVRDGKWFTIGDAGAEFFRYKKNDIVFNAAQTASLFKYGGIKGANPRGKMLATGTAFAEGKAFAGSSGTGGGTEVSGSIVVGTNKNTGKTYTKSTDKDSSKDFEETFDLIEIAIKRIEREIDNLDQKANNVYKSWSSRNTALASEISKVGSEINLQQKAYNEYMKAASGTGLSSDWVKKIQNGEIDIETVKDEVLAEKIKDYEDFYEKALAAKDAIEELREEESKLYAQRFENIQTQYDGILQGYEHTEAMLNEYISQAEEQGHIVSTKYYNALINNEKQNIAELKKEQSALIAERDKAVDSGKITKGSEAWYDMCAEIDGVTQAIEEGETALLEYARAIDEINWGVFDLIQERISDITAESDFLIELMSNDKLFDDKGKLTGQGAATMGLHALNYNKSMYSADDYQSEINELDKQIAKNPYDQELVNRRRELVESQREQILAAEDCKNAIKDLLDDAYSQELDYLQEKIDKTNEAIDSQKD